MEKFPRNLRMKVNLKEKIDKRKRFLRILREQDYKKYEWILEKLDLVHKSYPETYFRVERKASLRKLTDIHCEEIKEKRLDAYRKELESQQLGFLEKKIQTLQFIRDEQVACKIKVTVTLEEIAAAKLQYKELLEKQNSNGGTEKVAKTI